MEITFLKMVMENLGHPNYNITAKRIITGIYDFLSKGALRLTLEGMKKIPEVKKWYTRQRWWP